MGEIEYDFSVESKAPPGKFLAAAIDFTENRLRYWPSLSAKRYKVYSVGDHIADVAEGTGPVWNRIQYEWTDDTVRSVSTQGNAAKPGEVWQMKVMPHEGGGSHIEIHLEVEPSGLLGLISRPVLWFNGGAQFFQKAFLKTVAIVEGESES